MILNGHGEISVAPDIAIIMLGVETLGANVTETQQDNADRMNQVIHSMKDLNVKDIKTTQYTIDRNFEYINGRRIDRGFVVRNLIQITIDDLNMVGTVIDTGIKQGVNIIQSITFDVENKDYYYKEALNFALTNAMNKADSMAKHLGITVTLIPARITENTSPVIPFTRDIALRESMQATPILPGENKIEANITVEILY